MITVYKMRIYLIVFGFSLSLISCGNWKYLSDTNNYSVVYDNGMNTILMFDSAEQLIYKKSIDVNNSQVKLTDIQKIKSPNSSNVQEICAFNDIWISSVILPKGLPPTSFFSTPGRSILDTIYYYSDISGEWIEIKSLYAPLSCRVFSNNGVVFWAKKEIFVFDEKNNQKIYTTNKEIDDITSNNDGILWFATPSGEIYRQSNEIWELFDVLSTNYPNNTNIFMDKNNNLWVASNSKYVYRYRSTNLNKELIFQSDLGWVQTFFEDKNGKLWLATNNNLFIYKEDEFHEFPLPFNTDVVTSIFVTNDNFLMVNTENGLYYLDLNNQQKSDLFD